MTESTPGQGALARRLRELRSQWAGTVVTQRQLAQALNVSVSLVSSWESATTPALPNEDWLQAYALFFASPRSLEPAPHLLEQRQLSHEEEQARRALVDELAELRDAALQPAGSRARAGALGGTFYFFPDNLPVRIICGRLAEYELMRQPPPVQELLDAARQVLAATDEPEPAVAAAVAELAHYQPVVEALRTLKEAARVARAQAPAHDRTDPPDPLLRSLTLIGDALANIEDSGVQYANPWHPNAISSLWNADMDAAAELAQHVIAENPGIDVQIVLESEVTARDLTAGHLIVLGQGDSLLGRELSGRAAPRTGAPLNYLAERLDLPIYTELAPGGDPEYDGRFVVRADEEGVPTRDGRRRDAYAPRFVLQDGERVLDHGVPPLEYDVALIVRTTNPFNQGATVTACTGIFSRGTYGAVRALTDPTLRGRNEQFLRDRFGAVGFWLLLHVPVISTISGAKTLTPDLTRGFHRLRSALL